MYYLKAYLRNFHFSINFWSVLLILSFIPDLVGIDSSILRYGFWAFKSVLAFWVVYNYKKKVYHLNWREKIFTYVGVIFFLNIFFDVFLEKGRNGLGSIVDLISFVLVLLIAFSFRYNIVITGKKSFEFFIASLLVGLVIAYVLAVPSPAPWVGRMDASSSFNTINYGQLGCSMALIAMFGILKYKGSLSKVFFIFCFLLGFASIMKAGSRSPLVVFSVVMSFYIVAKVGILQGLSILMVSLLVLWGISGFLIEIANAMGSELPLRLMNAINSGDTSGRDEIYINSITLIKNSWFFGDYYLVSSGVGKGSYPHNFILEAFQTTGILGGIPFLFLLGLTIQKSYRAIRDGHPSTWLVIIFLQLVVYGMFSSSLCSSQDFWALCFFIISMPETKIAIKNQLFDHNKNNAI